MRLKNKKIVIATGGTGGHIFPAYSLAKHLIENKFHVEIISDKRGIKYLKKNEDLKITQIASATIFNKNVLNSLFSALIVLYALLKSFIFLLINRPNLVFGMGGYSSFPVCIVAKILRVPFIIYENNLHIGKANKFLLPYANKVIVSHKELDGVPKKYQNKIFEIGNIIRKEIIVFRSNKKIVKNDELKILVLGGSQAAKIFGEKLPEIFKQCHQANIPIKIYQQCMSNQNQSLTSFYNNLKIDFEIFNFSHNLLDYFYRVNLAITRSGASMLAELINAKIPFISVPLPTSAENHQLKNAAYYKKNGYSYLIEEKDLNTKLFELLNMINKNPNVLSQIIKKQSQYSDKSVYENIDKQIYEILNEKN